MSDLLQILVIDDSEDDRLLYQRCLKRSEGARYAVSETANGDDGLARIDEQKFACVLLDYSLPGRNGVEILKRIRAKYPFVPVVMLTGLGNEKVAVAAMQEGAQNYISKAAIDSQTLAHVIQIAIQQCDNIKLLKENAERYRAIVDTAVDAIIVADRFGKVQSINRAAETIFGYAAEEVVDRNLEFLMPDTHDGYLATHRDTGERKIIGIGREVIGLRKNGSTVALELSVAEWRDIDGQQCFTRIMRDVTQRNMQARELRKATELAQQATEIAQQARLEAESANRAKTEFLAVMSHEIRTPMTSISGFVDLLMNTGELTSKQRRYIELVKIANAALLTIVDDILDFSKVEAGRLDLESLPFSLSTLIQDAVAIVLPIASAKNLVLEHAVDRSVPGWLTGDPARLRQVLLNLLNNAIKFTEKGSITIDVCAQTSADGRERIRFSVVDTGIGIPAEQQHRLFRKFSQGDSSISRRHGGTGLGLAICKRLVELMDGEIGVLSEVDRGSTIWFTAYLPLASQPTAPPQIEFPPQEAGTRKARILVVDDLDTNREIVEAYLGDNGYSVETAGSASEAIRLLQNGRYDLVLMDIQMPVMDGVAATRCIRALSDSIKNIPIIAMTGNVLPQQVLSFLAAGMNDHVGKPIERAKLYDNVLRWLPKIEGPEVSVTLNSPHFDRPKCEEFVRALGAERAGRTAAKFLDQITEAFKSTPENTHREAHDLINCAGLLGFHSLVEACRAVGQASLEDADHQTAALEEARTAQALARETLITRILPRLRAASLRPTG
jgi:PAS domain S-box-containing protein